jgi:hypothetical protein
MLREYYRIVRTDDASVVEPVPYRSERTAAMLSERSPPVNGDVD